MNFRVKFIENTDSFEPKFIEEDMTFKADFGEFHTIASDNAVLYTPQTLTEEQQAQARENIGIISGDGDKNFIFEQYSASDNWIVYHGLGKYPSVTVVDSANTVVCGDIVYLDANSLEVHFSAAFSGRAYLN